jgi:hypothetical protein
MKDVTCHSCLTDSFAGSGGPYHSSPSRVSVHPHLSPTPFFPIQLAVSSLFFQGVVRHRFGYFTLLHIDLYRST